MGASESGGGIDLPAFGDEREFVIEGPAVGEGFAEVFGIAAFESHATGVIAEATEFFDFVGVELNVRQGGEVIDFRFDGFGLGADFLDHRGDDALDGGLAEIPEAGELEGGDAVFFGDVAHGLEFFVTEFHPTCGAKSAMIAFAELVAWLDIAVEDAAVIDYAGDEFDLMFFGWGKGEGAWPRFEGIENNHCPIEEGAEAFEAEDEVESEAVGGSWSDAEAVGEFGVAEFIHGVPDGIAGVADGVGVVEHQAIEAVDLAAGELGFGGLADVAGVIA